MLDANDVISRLKHLLGLKTDLELANLLEIKPNTLSSWKIRAMVRYDKIIEVCTKYKIDLNEVFLIHPNSVYNVDLEDRIVKMISVDHHIEYFMNPDKCLASSPCCVFPTEEAVDIAFQLGVEHMFPTIKVSSYLLSKRIELSEMKPWNIYVLVVENRGILCYRFKRKTEANTLLFVADNEAFESLTLREDEIREVFCIRGIFLPHVKNLSKI
ncbi:MULTISPECIES: helix-turn-helix domain-containing protein [unclassified Myroides]|uniref:helix-turn-helix domain-containing protein n=1 Tax=unclassified Myroides TaxID=2642485 RepID=UPI0015FD2B42|nr:MULTISPECIES: helix-turn-helix domain-containing protein [unclassified Myroides]MBB1149615.1 helix-turn-helix domain-containing protein [Myroides sp. NP-2]MDM1407087.1 helix-turn-helix domain-containing protein [Myroides sp. DF42-4-2]